MPTYHKTNQFNNPLLSKIYDLTIYLFNPFWYSLDESLKNILTVENPNRKTTPPTKCHRLSSYLFHTFLVILSLPFIILAFPVWLILLPFQNRYYRTVENLEKLAENKVKLFEENGKKFSVMTANVCLLSEIACRVNRLEDHRLRSEKIARRVLGCPEELKRIEQLPGLRVSETEQTDFIQSYVPPDLDVLCLQECFTRSCAQKLANKLKQKFPFIIWDIGLFLSPKLGSDRKFFALENSGLFLASKYPIVKHKFKPFNNACYGDAFASKGALFCILELTENIYAIVCNTHLQAQEGDLPSKIRVNQLKYIHSEMAKLKSEFLHENSNYSDNCIKFEILLGDLNFDLFSDKIENKVFFKPGYFKEFQDAHLGSKTIPTALYQENIYKGCCSSDDMIEKLIGESKTITNFKKVLPVMDQNVNNLARKGRVESIMSRNSRNDEELLSPSKINEKYKLAREDSECSTNSSSCVIQIDHNDDKTSVTQKRQRSLSVSSGLGTSCTMIESSKSKSEQNGGREGENQKLLLSNKISVDSKVTVPPSTNQTKSIDKGSTNSISSTSAVSVASAASATSNVSSPFDHKTEENKELKEKPTVQKLFENHSKTKIPLKLDHIWFDPKFCKRVASRYITAFYHLSDHVPIAAEFMVKE